MSACKHQHIVVYDIIIQCSKFKSNSGEIPIYKKPTLDRRRHRASHTNTSA